MQARCITHASHSCAHRRRVHQLPATIRSRISNSPNADDDPIDDYQTRVVTRLLTVPRRSGQFVRDTATWSHLVHYQLSMTPDTILRLLAPTPAADLGHGDGDGVQSVSSSRSCVCVNVHQWQYLVLSMFTLDEEVDMLHADGHHRR